MKSTKSIQNGLKSIIAKDNKLDSLSTKYLISTLRKKANSNIPMDYQEDFKDKSKEYNIMLKKSEYFDTIKNNPNNFEAKKHIESKQSLYYLNKTAKVDMEKINKLKNQKVLNITNEINKKFTLKKNEATRHSKRTGLLGYKIGMTGLWDKFGTWHPLTVLKIDRCQIVAHKHFEKENYYAMEVGCGEKKVAKTTRPMLGHFIKHGVPPKEFVKEFEVTKENLLPSGYVLTVRHFIPGQFVDVKGISKGHGWTGQMVRWNFKGQGASHGNSLSHRMGVNN
jgi:large subunit ribosomal protein L3